LFLGWGCSPENAVSETEARKQGPSLTLDYSPARSGHIFRGMGVALYGQETQHLSRLHDLEVRYVRLEAGPSWASLPHSPPAQPGQLARYVRNNFNYNDPDRLLRFQESFAYFQEHNIKSVLVFYQQPYLWLQNDYMNTFRPGAEVNLIRLWVAVLKYLQKHGIRPDYVELANEPEGNWNGHIPRHRYHELVVQARKQFDRVGLSHIQILGPGLSTLNLEGRTPLWMDSMPVETEQSLSAFSFHAWDDVLAEDRTLNFMRNAWDSLKQTLGRRNAQKEIILTEYGWELTRKGYNDYHSPRSRALFSVSDTHQYGIRYAANSLIHINQGASAIVAWRLSDLNADYSSWGMVRSRDRGGTPRPFYHAFRFLSNQALQGSRVVMPASPLRDDTLEALLLCRDGRCVWIAVNTGMDWRRVAIEVTTQPVLYSVIRFREEGIRDFCVRKGSELYIDLPPASIGALQWW